MKNLTPQHLRCAPLHCPSVHELEDGRLLIIGARSGPELAHFVNERLGNGETAIVISEDLLSDYVAGKLAEASAEIERLVDALDSDEFVALKAQVERLREALEPLAKHASAYDPDEGDGHQLMWAAHEITIGDLRRARAALSQQEGA